MTVYIDVLIILNLYINFILVRTAALFLRKSVDRRKCVFAALLGALGSMIILAPTLPFYVNIPYKILLCAGMVLIAFGKQKFRDFLVSGLFFLLVGFLFGGILTGIETVLAPNGMILNNGVCFFNIPIAALVSFTAAAFFLMKLVKRLTDSKTKRFCTIKITQNGASVTLRGLCDTGCEVRDIFLGKPVIVCDYEKAAAVVPAEIVDYLAGKVEALEKIRLIPCQTVSSSAAIPVFKAQSILIDGKQADALVGISKSKLGDEVDCVFNPRIIPAA